MLGAALPVPVAPSVLMAAAVMDRSTTFARASAKAAVAVGAAMSAAMVNEPAAAAAAPAISAAAPPRPSESEEDLAGVVAAKAQRSD